MSKNNKFLHEIKENDRPEEYCEKPNIVSGMKIVKLCYVKVEDIIRGGLNKARSKGAKEIKISKIMRVIDAGKHRPFSYPPPVITTDWRLVAGEHRLCAHEGCDEEWIWVAICEFDSDTRATAYSFVENNEEHDFGHDLSDDEDLVFNVKQALQSNDGEVKPNKSSIRKYIKSLNYKGSIEAIVTRVMIEIDISWVPLHAATHKDMVEKYEEVYGINPDTDDSIWVGGLIGTEKVAYFARCIRAILPTLLKGEDVTIVTKFNKTKSFQFESNRKRIANELRSYILNSARAIVNAADSAKGFGKINYRFIKQLPTDPTFTEINSNEK